MADAPRGKEEQCLILPLGFQLISYKTKMKKANFSRHSLFPLFIPVSFQPHSTYSLCYVFVPSISLLPFIDCYINSLYSSLLFHNFVPSSFFLLTYPFFQFFFTLYSPPPFASKSNFFSRYTYTQVFPFLHQAPILLYLIPLRK